MSSSGLISGSVSASSPGPTILYYNPHSSPSRKVLIALYEKRAEFEKVELNLREGEQFQDWYVRLNPRAEVPVLKKNDQIVCDSTDILKFIDRNYGRPYLLFPHDNEKVNTFLRKIDAIPMFPLTYGIACFHPNGVTERLRWPYTTYDLAAWRGALKKRPETLKQQAARHAQSLPAVQQELDRKSFEAEEVLRLFNDRKRCVSLIEIVEAVLDDVEAELGSDTRSGPWLCGPIFSAADIALTCLLMRLYQLGLDDSLWKGGERPNISVYQELAFRRPSVERATEWRAHQKEEVKVSRYIPPAAAAPAHQPPQTNGDYHAPTNGNMNGGGSDGDLSASSPTEEQIGGLEAARVGLGAILVLGGIYAARKLVMRK